MKTRKVYIPKRYPNGDKRSLMDAASLVKSKFRPTDLVKYTGEDHEKYEFSVTQTSGFGRYRVE